VNEMGQMKIIEIIKNVKNGDRMIKELVQCSCSDCRDALKVLESYPVKKIRTPEEMTKRM